MFPIDNVFFLHRLCFDCTNVPSYGNSTSYHTLTFGKQSPLAWTFFFSENNTTYSAFLAGYKCLGGIEHVTPILINKSLQFVNRIMQALPENCDDFLHLLDPTTVAATPVIWLPVLGLAGLQREVPQMPA